MAGAADDARGAALRLLSRRDYSVHELYERLLERGYCESDARDAADWLTELRYLDDEKYARGLMERSVAKGFGYERCLRDMKRRGIDGDIIGLVLDDYPDSDETLCAFIERLCKGQAPDFKQRGRIIGALTRRGFDLDEILEAIRRYI